MLEPTSAELVALQVGAAYLELRSNDNVTVVMRTRVPQVIQAYIIKTKVTCCLLSFYAWKTGSIF